MILTEKKVIFHLHDEEKAVTAISNVINLIKYLGEENTEIELLMNGDGVNMMLKGSEHERKLDYLLEKGVKFSVCSNSLSALDFSEDEILDLAEIVPSGVGELVEKQDEGWNYIKV